MPVLLLCLSAKEMFSSMEWYCHSGYAVAMALIHTVQCYSYRVCVQMCTCSSEHLCLGRMLLTKHFSTGGPRQDAHTQGRTCESSCWKMAHNRSLHALRDQGPVANTTGYAILRCCRTRYLFLAERTTLAGCNLSSLLVWLLLRRSDAWRSND